jgi:hypothetical protein
MPHPVKTVCVFQVFQDLNLRCKQLDVCPKFQAIYVYLCRAREGSPAAVLPVLHYVILGFSKHVARFIAEKGYEVCCRLI